MKLDLNDKNNISINTNGLYFVLIKAFKDITGKDIIIEHSLDKGTYCETESKITIDLLEQIKEKMKNLIEKDIKIEKIIVDKESAKDYYQKNKMEDKIKLLKMVTSNVLTLYKLDNIYDYFYSEMPTSTGELSDFDLIYLNEYSMVLTYPTIYSKGEVPEYTHREKMYKVFKEYTDWAKSINMNNAPDLNEAIIAGKGEELIRISETKQNSCIAEIAKEINSRKQNLKLILVAGPSSSGKTTTAKKLATHLKTLGLNIKNLSTDDYYVDRIDTPKKEDGTYDYETVEAIDIKLFNEHLEKLVNGEEINFPKYNFIEGKKEFDENNKMKLENNDMLIIEGIHAHNEKLTESINNEKKYKIYISSLTQLNLDNHNRIHTTDIRLLRRMVRDRKYRGYKAIDTIKEWKDVRAGEEKWLFPNQDNVDVILNSALLYEIAVLKPFAEPLLYGIDQSDEEYVEAKRLILLLRNFLPLSSEEVPKDSHLREFIGGSSFRKEN